MKSEPIKKDDKGNVFIEPAHLAKLMCVTPAAIFQRMECGTLASAEVPTAKRMIPLDDALRVLEDVDAREAKKLKTKLKREGWL